MRLSGSMIVLVVLASCSPKSDETAETGETTVATNVATETGTGAGTEPTGGAASALGKPCTHAGELGFEKGPRLTPFDAACGDELCVFAKDLQPPADPCTDDAMCNVFEPNIAQFQCIEEACVLADLYKAERSMCAASCATDDECADADPNTNCVNGFKCVIVTPSCCTPMCMCLDDLSAGSIDFATIECAKQPEPGCEF